jgi:hypothetical protein
MSANFRHIFWNAGFLAFSIMAFDSCKPEKVKLSEKAVYFDMKGFFRTDSARLANKNTIVTKTVYHNGVAETKKIHVINWGNELRLFSQSDINKPAWKSSYDIVSADNMVLYQAKSPELTTRKIIIKKDGVKVRWIRIYNHTKNMLYESTEQLTYFPDSLYVIAKKQSVRLIGTNTYQIKGVINQ